MSTLAEVGIALPSTHCDNKFESTAVASKSSASTVGVSRHMLEIWTTLARLRAARDIAIDVSVASLMGRRRVTAALRV